MKKLFVILSLFTSICYAGLFDSVPSVSGIQNTSSCISSCDEGAIMKALNVSASQAKSLSATACQTACADQCFAGKINSDSSSEVAAFACQDSLKNTFKLN